MLKSKIEINQAYDPDTQQKLFKDMVEGNLVEGEYLTPGEIFDAQQLKPSYDNLDDLANSLFAFYQNRGLHATLSVPEQVIFHVLINYAEWLHDDIIDGRIQLIKLNNNDHTIYVVKHCLRKTII